MNKIFLFILVILTFGCSDSEKKPIKSKQSKLEIERNESYSQSKEYIDENEEKIYLLATTKNMSFESLNSLLIEYYSELKIIDKKNESRDNLFLNLATKYKLSKKEIAKIIYSFQYEMITTEEAISIEIEDNIDPGDNEPDYH